MEDNTSPHQQYDNTLQNQQPDKNEVPQQPSTGNVPQQPFPDEQTQQLDDSQKLVLPGQQPPTPSFHSDATQTFDSVPSPQPQQLNQAPNQAPGYVGPPANGSSSNKWKLSAMIAWTLVAVLVSTLLFFFAQSALGALGTSSQKGQVAATPSPVTTANHVPTITPNTNATPVQNIGTIAIAPGNIQVTRDCQVDNGYRCTITLMAAQGQSRAQSWEAETDNLKTKFHPHEGTLQPGQQQQIILYVYNQCPYTGHMVFTVDDSTASVPLQC
jgi:hypothetical protein